LDPGADESIEGGSVAVALGTLNGATQTLPTLISLPSSDFHKTGSLTTTGLGTLNVDSLVTDPAFVVKAWGFKAASIMIRPGVSLLATAKSI
jgi:ABC-type sulfate transport system permease subunit